MINTLNVSHGFGYIVLKAAKMINNGASFDEVIAACENFKSKVKDFFAVPDIDFLYKTGNVTKAGAKATKVFGITPVLKLGSQGKATLANKVVGDNRIAQCFVNEFKHNGNKEIENFVIIGYSTDKTRATLVREMLFKQTGFTGDIYIMQMRPAFGVHMGKRAVAIYFMGKTSSIALFNLFRSS